MLVVKDLFNVHPNCCCSSDLNASLRVNYTCQSWRAKQNHKYWSIVRFCVWVQSQLAKVSFNSQPFPSIINSCTTKNRGGGGVALNFAILHVQLYIRMCPTLFWCYAVESLVMNSEQVQIGCSTSCCSEPSTTYAVLKWFLLFLFLSRFTSCVSSLVHVVLTLLLGYSKVEYIDNGWKMFSVILFKHFYVPMNVILKDGHPIHICNCLKACSFVSSPCPTVKHESLYIKHKAVSLLHSCPLSNHSVNQATLM